MATQVTNEPKKSILHGPTEPPLLDLTLGDFLDIQCKHFGNRECIVIPWTKTRWTFDDLAHQSSYLARYLLERGISRGDRLGILAGNRAEYAAVFFACMRIGAALVILNNTYTTVEAEYALRYTGCKILFATPWIGKTDNTSMLETFDRYKGTSALFDLKQIISLSHQPDRYFNYSDAIVIGSKLADDALCQVQSSLSPYDLCNLQFTSGSTGQPKAAMLVHHGLLNNAQFLAHRMAFTAEDILCCPPPLFHIFGLVNGLLATMSQGAKIVFPSEVFDGPAVLRSICDEQCTAIHGVPAMFDTLFSLPRPEGFQSRLRTGIIAGAPVPRHLMELLVKDFGMTEFTSSYGLTEASSACFNAHVHDPIQRKLNSVGKIMPHSNVKLVDPHGRIVPVGRRGEVCISGYQIQQGYWRNDEKTREAMVYDDDGVRWLHTGDEAVFDHEGYAKITGRIKDMIIRGGENIYPLEIEDRLVEHPSIERAIVVGMPHQRLGEVVSAFLQADRSEFERRPSIDDLRRWTMERLGRQKAPVYIWWLGDEGVPADLPVTGSGKIKKFEMRRLGRGLLASSSPSTHFPAESKL